MAPSVPISPPVVLLRASAVSACVGIGRARIYDLIRRGRFPRPVRLHGRSVAWISSEIEAWIATRTERAGGPKHTNAPAGTEASSAHVDA